MSYVPLPVEMLQELLSRMRASTDENITSYVQPLINESFDALKPFWESQGIIPKM